MTINKKGQEDEVEVDMNKEVQEYGKAVGV